MLRAAWRNWNGVPAALWTSPGGLPVSAYPRLILPHAPGRFSLGVEIREVSFMVRNPPVKKFSDELNRGDAFARRLVLGETEDLTRCVKTIPSDEDPAATYRVIGRTQVQCNGQSIILANGLILRVGRYGAENVKNWVENRGLKMVLVDRPGNSPDLDAPKPSNDVESCDEAPGVPVEATEIPAVSEPSPEKKKPGRPPSRGPVFNPFAPKKK